MSRRLYGSIEVTDYTVDTVAYPATAVDIIKFREQFSASYTGSAELVRVEVGNAVPTWWMDLVFDDTTRFTVTTNVDWATLVTTAATWGISLEATQPTGWAYIPVTFNYGVTNEATIINTLYGEAGRVSKLYGSVNGATKLVYQDFGHADYSRPVYGIVYYDSGSEVKSVELQSMAEFQSLGEASSSWTANVGGGTVSVTNSTIRGVEIGSQINEIQDYFLHFCRNFDNLGQPLVIPDNVTKIGDVVMTLCSSFYPPIAFPSTLTSIGRNFLNNCVNFNQPITLPDSLTTIGIYFMYHCINFNQTLVLPNRLSSIGTYFLYECQNMTSEVDVGSLPATIAASSDYTFGAYSDSYACYTTGIKIAGANRAAWLSRFPNRSSRPYRKLVDAGH